MEQFGFKKELRFQFDNALREVHRRVFDREHVNTVVNLHTDQKMLAHAVEFELLGLLPPLGLAALGVLHRLTEIPLELDNTALNQVTITFDNAIPQFSSFHALLFSPAARHGEIHWEWRKAYRRLNFG